MSFTFLETSDYELMRNICTISFVLLWEDEANVQPGILKGQTCKIMKYTPHLEFLFLAQIQDGPSMHSKNSAGLQTGFIRDESSYCLSVEYERLSGDAVS